MRRFPANATLLDLIDIKEIQNCRVKINGTSYDIVHLVTEKEKYFAMVAGGYLIEVPMEIFYQLQKQLQEHFIKFVKGR